MDIRNSGCVVVTDYVKANSCCDVAAELQKLINENPNKTLYFPDGEYLISQPLKTSANPVRSVHLELANYAVIKACDDWQSDDAMIMFGAAEPFNDIDTNGSNYGINGGIVDGNGKASGISIDSGRETRISNVSLKHVKVGIRIKYGANNCSSDADVRDVNIVGTGKKDSVGVIVEGADNTFTNMRIASVYVGVEVHFGGNFFRCIHPLYIFTPELEGKYDDSVGFWDHASGNWYDTCYSDQFATGFRMEAKTVSNYINCYCFWYNNDVRLHRGFHAVDKFNSLMSGCKVEFCSSKPENSYITVANKGGAGIISHPIMKDKYATDKTYEDYLEGGVIHLL